MAIEEARERGLLRWELLELCELCLAKVFAAEVEVGQENKTLWLWFFHLVGFLWKVNRLSLGMLMGYIRSKG